MLPPEPHEPAEASELRDTEHKGIVTLKRQKRRGLNLSFPFLSSKDRKVINCSTNFGSEKWSNIICSAYKVKENENNIKGLKSI